MKETEESKRKGKPQTTAEKHVAMMKKLRMHRSTRDLKMNKFRMKKGKFG